MIMEATTDTVVSIKSIQKTNFKVAAQQPTWGYQHIKTPSALNSVIQEKE